MRAIDYFDKGAEAFPRRIAIIDRETQYAYRQMQEASHKIARAMWARGLDGEERAAIFSPNDARILPGHPGFFITAAFTSKSER